MIHKIYEGSHLIIDGHTTIKGLGQKKSEQFLKDEKCFPTNELLDLMDDEDWLIHMDWYMGGLAGAGWYFVLDKNFQPKYSEWSYIS